MARPRSTEQEMGTSVFLPCATRVILELDAACRYASFKGRCSDLISIRFLSNPGHYICAFTGRARLADFAECAPTLRCYLKSGSALGKFNLLFWIDRDWSSSQMQEA